MELNIKQHADAVLQAIESTILFKRAADLLKQFETTHPEVAAFFSSHSEAHAAADAFIADAHAALPEIKAAASKEVETIKGDAVDAITLAKTEAVATEQIAVGEVKELSGFFSDVVPGSTPSEAVTTESAVADAPAPAPATSAGTESAAT